MTHARVVDGPGGLRELVGAHVGFSDWLEVTQNRVDQFADATGDHQWIHVDPQRAAEGPFGATIAHGYLTLSLLPVFIPQILDIRGFPMSINYGCDKVRFPAPVRVGRRLRAGAQVEAVEDVPGGVQLRMTVTFEIEDEPKPACVAEVLTRHYP